MLYPYGYVWFIFLSGLDVALTAVILSLDGSEINPLANLLFQWAGMYGLLALKIAAVICVVLICEYVGRRQPLKGLAIVRLAVILSSLPVLVALTQLVSVYA